METILNAVSEIVVNQVNMSLSEILVLYAISIGFNYIYKQLLKEVAPYAL